ncbi:hypothetical protein H9Y04_07475 [Streptomyces sp. TRM66268-LWL]|uniref:Uncharacterized protein n=1 Tax=Streptomyces polyasparticus TaxID=2767826 RepID=A0ABR7SAA4_9ACTN|nr:hypothetical protein [Streptomyces polyasparticus]MBC9712410.1 hypothetical protein [Streptomyces polyasparticus]
MGSSRRVRRLAVDDTTYEWCFAHRHDRGRGYSGCRSIVTVWRPGSRARLRFVFRPGPGRIISDGYFEEGAAVRVPDRAYLNLHEPGTVRALLDEHLAGGPFPGAGSVEVDGWALFDAVAGPPPPVR